MWNWLRTLVSGRASARYGTESDVEPDYEQSRIRAPHSPDRPGSGGTYVGRIAPDDQGDVEPDRGDG